jgi:phosphopantothenoylcysteine decarboxylase/phosphopantothenate--cysteine ligase
MHAAVLAALPRATLVIKAAAVADFRPTQVVNRKLHRADGLTLTLEPTADIAADVVRHRRPGTRVIAFAAEIPEPGTDPLARAREKLLRKGVDAIVVNDVSGSEAGFDTDLNSGVMIFPDHEVHIPLTSKRQMAARILDELIR